MALQHEVAAPYRDLLHAVPFTGFLPGSVGAGAVPDPPHDNDMYLWYPSWLANNNRPAVFDFALIVPVPPIGVTSVRVHPSGVVSETNVVLAGIASVRFTLAALELPALCTMMV